MTENIELPPRVKNIIGNKYGRWTVVSFSHKAQRGCSWNCICDCGNGKIVNEGVLRNGKSKSCGCLKKEKSIERLSKNLVGEKFGKLTAIERLPNFKGIYTHYYCKCDCGNIVNVRGSALTTSNTISCGCHMKDTVMIRADAVRMFNKIVVKGNIAEIYLSNTDKVAIIDTDDVDKVKNFYWCIRTGGYAGAKKYNKVVMLHRLIANNTTKNPTDHKNRNKLDNRKCNLHITTHEYNAHNRDISKINTTGHKNIVHDKEKFACNFVYLGNTYYLGKFTNIEEAINERNKKYNELGIRIED